RRRRHGRPLENAEGAVQPQAQGAGAPAARAATPATPVAVQANDSFLTRLGRKIKALVGG
ncbi:MAG: ATP-dependent RNA helicase RhlB, partial [Pseudoxanthomonas sp.]